MSLSMVGFLLVIVLLVQVILLASRTRRERSWQVPEGWAVGHGESVFDPRPNWLAFDGVAPEGESCEFYGCPAVPTLLVVRPGGAGELLLSWYCHVHLSDIRRAFGSYHHCGSLPHPDLAVERANVVFSNVHKYDLLGDAPCQ